MESVLWWRGRAGGKGQDLESRTGYEDGVLPLRRQAVVLGDDGPAVGELANRRLAGVDHRFDREGHSRLQARAGFGTSVVQNLLPFVAMLLDYTAAALALVACVSR